MSNIDDYDIWQNVNPEIEIDYFRDWYNLEMLLGEFGEPGFSNTPLMMRWPSVNPDVPMEYIFTHYRNEDGLLLGVFMNYMSEEILKPFALYVHPDYQRRGIATALADFVIHQYEEQHGKKFSYSKSWGDVKMTESSAKWANNYVNKKIKGRIE